MVNIPELKGIHYAMHAGMYAAEAIVDALKKDSINFEAYDKRVRESRDRRGHLPLAQHAPAVLARASSWAARSRAR